MVSPQNARPPSTRPAVAQSAGAAEDLSRQASVACGGTIRMLTCRCKQQRLRLLLPCECHNLDHSAEGVQTGGGLTRLMSPRQWAPAGLCMRNSMAFCRWWSTD